MHNQTISKILFAAITATLSVTNYSMQNKNKTRTVSLYKSFTELKNYAVTGLMIGAGLNALRGLVAGGYMGATGGYLIGMVSNAGRGNIAHVPGYSIGGGIAGAGFIGFIGAGFGAVTGGVGGACCYGGKRLGKELFASDYAGPMGAVLSGTLVHRLMGMRLRYGLVHSAATVLLVELFYRKSL